MIIDLEKFVTAERPHWTELERMLNRLENEPDFEPDLDALRRLHYLYERASSDLARIATFSSEPEVHRYLENLVARAYGEIHETRQRAHRIRPVEWFMVTFPRTFRRRVGAFWLATALMLAGTVVGVAALLFEPDAKAMLMPRMFASHLGDPARRVAEEEQRVGSDRLSGRKTTFSAQLMRNNIQVSINALGLGLTYGIGTIIVLFYNGIILGLIGADYVQAGYGKFLAAWLLPHGSIEIPAILIASQAGLVLASALIGRGSRASLHERLRAASPDLATLIGGVAVLLVWAGFIEAFLSQYHEPVIRYEVKIAFGLVELGALIAFLSRAGIKPTKAELEESGMAPARSGAAGRPRTSLRA